MQGGARGLSARCIASVALAALSMYGGVARAQEDDTGDHGSRAAGKASQDDAPDHSSRAADKAPAAKRKAQRKAKAPFATGYHAGAFGGGFMQDGHLGLLLNAGANETLTLGPERLRLGLEYQYDPFTTKTFNFPEEDQTPDESRLAQGLHELDVRAEWQSRWSRWLQSSLNLSGDVWLPEARTDRRWSLRSDAELHVGKTRGPYVEPSAAWFFKKYPEYHVADRRIDQQGGEAALEAGYEWAPFTRAAVGVEAELTDYLDARYDELAADGSLLRASEDKTYLSTRPYASLAIAPVKPLRLSLTYSHEWNDSTHYTRRVPAHDELGNDVVKVIPEYYDYARDRLDVKAKWTPGEKLSLSTFAEGWLRDFDTYEARDADNVWTGQLRHDQSLELGSEISVHLLDVDTFKIQNALYATGFASHLLRRSNMRREVSLATNFDLTRVFVGLELRPR